MATTGFAAALKGRVYHAVPLLSSRTRCGYTGLPPIGLDQIRRKKLLPCHTCFVTKAKQF